MDKLFEDLYKSFINCKNDELKSKERLSEGLLSEEELLLIEDKTFNAEHNLLKYLCETYKLKPYQADEILYEGCTLEETLQKYDL